MITVSAKQFFFLILTAFVLPFLLVAKTEVPMDGLLIDDFSSRVSSLGTAWEGFTDQVMGGKSEMQSGIAVESGQRFLSLSGRVSLDNNGGFIQTRLMLSPEKNGVFDASRYSGIRITARGKGDGYYIFLRTTGNRFPWSFYMAPLPVTGGWTTVDIPWSRFEKGDFGSFFDLNLKKLTSLAVVAYKKEFLASIDVSRIAFY